MRIVPDEVATDWPADQRLPAIARRPPAPALEQALSRISQRYGERTAYMVSVQLEYARGGAMR